MGGSLFQDELQVFTQFLHKWFINFMWTYANIHGLDTNIVVHYLAVNLDAKVVKKKLRNMYPHVALLVKVELENILEAKFICPIDYSEWISIMVQVSNPSVDIIICTNFRDLNKVV